jgi:hypothetical protein
MTRVLVCAATITTIIVSLAPLPVHAQQSNVSRFTAAKSVRCAFTTMAIGNWRDDVAVVEIRPTKLTLGFDSVNTNEGTARILGDFGPSDIIVRLSEGGLHFVQSFREGPLYMTTIFPYENRPGQFKAVHTRHEYTEASVPGYTSKPEQYYGECEIGS